MTVESSARDAIEGLAAARERYRSTWPATLATAFALFVLSWTVTTVYWRATGTVRAFVPGVTLSGASGPQATDLSATLIAAAPFGHSLTGRPGEDLLPGVRLRGVIGRAQPRGANAHAAAGQANRVGAIINRGGADEYVALGKEIAPGIVLEEVHGNHVLVRQGARLQRVTIEDPASRTATPGLTAQPRSASAPPAANPSAPNQPPAGPPPGSPGGPLGRVGFTIGDNRAVAARIRL